MTEDLDGMGLRGLTVEDDNTCAECDPDRYYNRKRKQDDQ